MEKDENIIIKNCQGGDLRDFSLLYDKYIRKIYDFIYYKVQHRESAEDITSQVFLKALNKIGSYKTGKGTFQAWLYQIARNTVIDHYRTKKIDKNIDDVWDVSSNEDIERDTETKLKLGKVNEYISRLKSEQRDILIMRIWQEMSYTEIATVLGKSEASCKMQFSRTIRTLREEMPLAAFVALLFTRLS